jgi:hypothetical protein
MPSYTHKPKKNVISPDSVVPKKTDDEFPLTSGLQVLDEVFVTGKKRKSTPERRRRNRGIDNLSKDLFTPNAGNIISSGGDSDNVEVKDKLINKINTEHRDPSLYGSNRFNKLWSLYNKVKGVEGIENNPKYHKLIKKLSRKMPRTLTNLERNVDKSIEMRQKIASDLNSNAEVASRDEIISSARTRALDFIANPLYTPPKRDSQIDNEEDEIGGGAKKYSAGENLGSRSGTNPNLGSDISAALKNKKW